MALDPALDAELRRPVVTLFGAIELLLPHAAVRLLDGAGFVTFGGHTFTGRDETYGTIESVDAFSDGVDNEDPTLQVTLLPPSNTAAALLADPAAQGAQVSLWVGALNVRTGLPVADPELRFVGEVDVPTVVIDRNIRRLKLEVVSVFERFFSDDEGVRLSDAWHQSIWPGETGLAGVTSVQRKLPWGGTALRWPRSPRPCRRALAAAAGTAATSRCCGERRRLPAPRRRRPGDARPLSRQAVCLGRGGLRAPRRLHLA